MPYYLQTDEGDEYQFDDSIPEEEAVSWLDEALDVGRMIGQNMGASVVAGATGIGSLLWNQDVGQAVEDMNAVQEKLGYQPQTLEGQAIAAGLGAAGEAWEAPLNAAGEWVTDTTGSPLLGTIARTAPEVLLGGSMKRAMGAPKYKTGMAPDPKTQLTRQKGIFEGISSATFDKDLAKTVKNNLDAGADPIKLFNDTGYFKGIDGEMRKYSPHTALMKKDSIVDKLYTEEAFTSGATSRTLDLQTVLPASDPLVKGYKQHLKGIKVKFEYDPKLTRDASGFYTPPSNGKPAAITITTSNPHAAKVALVHEVQHLVQTIEKWKGQGANKESFFSGYTTVDDLSKPERVAAIHSNVGLPWDDKVSALENLDYWRELATGKKTLGPGEEIPDGIKQIILDTVNAEIKHLMPIHQSRHPTRMYETNAGEVEARIAEDWIEAPPHKGIPSDEKSIADSVRIGIDEGKLAWAMPGRTITPEDIHYRVRDEGAFLKRSKGKAALPSEFGHIRDKYPYGYKLPSKKK